jgi:PhnB protein
MARLETYIFFNGNCAEAMRFYERVLGGKIEMMMTYGESPSPEPAGSEHLIIHASLRFGDNVLMASDDAMTKPYPGMKGFALSLSYDDVAEGERVFNALAEGGSTTMPWSETFWAERFGMLTDRFGTPWMVSGGTSKG